MLEHRKAMFRKLRAEWEEEVRHLPPEERYITDKVLHFGYRLVYAERDPEKRDAFREWLDWPVCNS